MSRLLSYSVVAIFSAGIGFVASRTFSNTDSEKATPTTSDSSFEADALGFINWYRLTGRDQISHEELKRNLQILESKAIASGVLIAFQPSKSISEQDDYSGGDTPSN